MAKKKTIPIAKIKVDAATHPREELNVQTAEEYGQAMKAGEKFPPIIVFQKGKQYFLADGRHRLEGAKQFVKGDVKPWRGAEQKRSAHAYVYPGEVRGVKVQSLELVGRLRLIRRWLSRRR